MAIASTDIQFRLTTATGPGNSTAGSPNTSLGGFASTTPVTDATIGNVFDNVSGDENAASESEYRGLAILNNHASLTWQAPVAWISSETAGGASLALSVDTTAASALASASAQMKSVANEDTAPATQAFSAPTTKATGLALSDLPAGNVKGLWLRRTAANTAALDNDGAIVRIEGDTAA